MIASGVPLHTDGAGGVIVAMGGALVTMANDGETVPVAHPFVPRTVRLPEVAPDAKSIVTLFPVPLIVAPVPEYAQI